MLVMDFAKMDILLKSIDMKVVEEGTYFCSGRYIAVQNKKYLGFTVFENCPTTQKMILYEYGIRQEFL